jgi:hypothetical protein
MRRMPCRLQIEEAVGAGHRLEDEAGNRLRPLEHDDVLEIGERVAHVLPAAAAQAAPRVLDVHHAGRPRLRRPAPRVAGERDRGAGGAVVRAVARQDLVAAGELPRQLHGVLVGLGAAVGEEERVDVARRELRQPLAQPRPRLGGHERVGVGERRRLLLDGADHPLVPVPDVHAHQLAVEVEVALSLGRPEPAALRARHRDRIGLRLRRPLEQRVRLRQPDDLVAGHGRRSGGGRG